MIAKEDGVYKLLVCNPIIPENICDNLKMIARISGTIASVLIVTTSIGQTIEDASALLAQNQLDSAWVITKNILENDKSNVNAYVLAGRIQVVKKNFNEAFGYLEKAQTFSFAPTYAKAWTLIELGQCYYFKGDYKKAKENLTACIEMNATKNATSTATFLMFKLGLDKFYDNWIKKETSHFIFHFQDTSAVENLSRFLHKKEAAFDSINKFFKVKLPKKIDYFVWSNSRLAELLFKHPLAFSDGGLCITHTELNHTVGHEMTHSISFYSVQNAKWNRLIAEGVCVYFDFSKKDNLKILRSKNETPISIVDVWRNELKLGEEVLYPLGGELVKRLIETYGKEKFMQLLTDQTYDSAMKIYGAELDRTINKLEAEINL